ncbi:MAG: aquaporin [Rhodospirillales bacterium]
MDNAIPATVEAAAQPENEKTPSQAQDPAEKETADKAQPDKQQKKPVRKPAKTAAPKTAKPAETKPEMPTETQAEIQPSGTETLFTIWERFLKGSGKFLSAAAGWSRAEMPGHLRTALNLLAEMPGRVRTARDFLAEMPGRVRTARDSLSRAWGQAVKLANETNLKSVKALAVEKGPAVRTAVAQSLTATESDHQKLLAEYLGSMILTIAVISPLILSYNVFGASIPMALVMDALAVAFVYFVLIEILGPVSGCHINPAITAAMIATGKIDAWTGRRYILAQFIGGLSGTVVSHLMFFGEGFFSLFAVSDTVRTGGTYLSEIFCTFLLILTIFGCQHKKSKQTGLIVGFLVGGLMITVSSTMFGNPQVTLARMFTFAIGGVRIFDGLVFIAAQAAAVWLAVFVAGRLFGERPAAKE